MHNGDCVKKDNGCRTDSDCEEGMFCDGYQKAIAGINQCTGKYQEPATITKYSCVAKNGTDGEISRLECRKNHSAIHASGPQDCMDKSGEYGFYFNGKWYSSMSCLTRSDGNGFEIEKCPAPCRDITQASSCQKSENAEYCDWKSDTETLPETSYSCNVHGIIPYRNLICIVQGRSSSVNWSDWSHCEGFKWYYKGNFYTFNKKSCLIYSNLEGGIDYTIPPKCPVPQKVCDGLAQNACGDEQYCNPYIRNNTSTKDCISSWSAEECYNHHGCKMTSAGGVEEVMGICKKKTPTYTGTWSCKKEQAEGTCGAANRNAINGVSFTKIHDYCSKFESKNGCEVSGYCSSPLVGSACLQDDNYFCDMWDPSPFGGEVKYHTFCADNDKKLCSWGPGSLTIIPICSNNNCDPATKPDCPVESPTDGCAGTLEKVDWDGKKFDWERKKYYMSTSAGQYVTYACPSYSHRVVNDTRYTFYSSTCSEYSNPALPDAPGSNEPDEGPRVRTEYLSCPEGAEFIIPVGKVGGSTPEREFGCYIVSKEEGNKARFCDTKNSINEDIPSTPKSFTIVRKDISKSGWEKSFYDIGGSAKSYPFIISSKDKLSEDDIKKILTVYGRFPGKAPMVIPRIKYTLSCIDNGAKYECTILFSSLQVEDGGSYFLSSYPWALNNSIRLKLSIGPQEGSSL